MAKESSLGALAARIADLIQVHGEDKQVGIMRNGLYCQPILSLDYINTTRVVIMSTGLGYDSDSSDTSGVIIR